MFPSNGIPTRDLGPHRATAPARQGVVAVVHDGARFLMIQRAAGVLAPGAWCFVGGGIEDGETQEQALVREFAEEVGGDIRPVRKLWEWTRPDGALVLHWWLAELDGPELVANPAEVAAMRWLGPAEIKRLPNVLDSNLEFLERVGSGLFDAG